MPIDFSNPVELSSSLSVSAYDKLAAILGHYDLRIYVTDTAYIDVGRGSISAALRVVDVSPNFFGCIGTVGQFCDFSRCQLFGGGEHQNELPVNIMFNNVSVFANEIRDRGITSLASSPETPFSIGNAVLISADAKIMSGAQIDNGAVIAANALVRGTVEPFSIYGGLPAKKLKDRFVQTTKSAMATVHWWDFDTAYIGNNMRNLQSLAIDLDAQHVYRKPTPKFVIKLGSMGTGGANDIQILGFTDSDKLMPLSHALQRVRDYVAQLAGTGPYQWVANVWE